jgi:hypothetical protein
MNLQATPAKPAGSRERSLDEVKAELSVAAIKVVLLYKTSGCKGSVHESASHARKTGRIARALAG